MLEVISEIIKAEEEAKRIVDEARASATSMKSDMDKKEREALESTRREAEEKYRAAVAEAREAAEKRYHEAVRRQADKHKSLEEIHRSGIARAVERIVRLVSTPAYED